VTTNIGGVGPRSGSSPTAIARSATLLKTPGLSLGAGGWTLQLEGDKTALNDVSLVLTYRAGV